MTTKQPQKPHKKSQISRDPDKKPKSKVEFDLSDEQLENVSGGMPTSGAGYSLTRPTNSAT